MTPEDNGNISTLAADPRFKSLVKLMNNQKATFLTQSVFGRLEEEDKAIYRGGALALTAIFTAIDGEILKEQSQRVEDEARKRGLDMIGW